MRTLIISDLHLGSVSGADVLRRAPARERLVAALEGIDRLVLLGDALELRHGPRHVSIAAARPFFQEVGEAMAGGEIVIVPGNHDHMLLSGWLSARSETAGAPPLGLEQRLEAAEGSSLLGAIAEWASPAHLTAAYPGLWLRGDVYAMHGHFLDNHLTIPTIERLALAVMARMLHRSPEALRSVSDYESVSAPVFAWIDAIARHGHTGSAFNGSATVAMWQALGGGADGRERTSRRGRLELTALARQLRRGALLGAFPVAVAALNRAGLGPLRSEISAGELRRAGLRAMGEVAARLGLSDAHVIFGHTHRAGPLPGDEPQEWRGRLGARLVNCGAWTYNPTFLPGAPGESPYWPGSCVIVEPDGGPRVQRLLLGLSHAELRAPLHAGMHASQHASR